MSELGRFKKLIKRAEAQGFRHTILGSGHHRFYAPDGVTIVQRSGTKDENDNGYMRGFMCEMRRAGYKTEQEQAEEARTMNQHNGATTNMGDVLKAALETPLPQAKPAQSIQHIVLDLLTLRAPGHVGVPELQLVLKDRRPDVTNVNAVSTALNKLLETGKIRRIGHGVYGLATAVSPPRVTTATAVPPQGGTAAPVPAADDGCYEDPDQRELDEALAALGRIETVVRKYRGKIAEINKLKRLLAGVDL